MTPLVPAMVPIEMAAETVVLRSAVALRRALVMRILILGRKKVVGGGTLKIIRLEVYY